MSDAAVTDTAGPSTVTDSEIEQGLRDAELNFQQGIQALQVRCRTTVLTQGAQALFSWRQTFTVLSCHRTTNGLYTGKQQ